MTFKILIIEDNHSFIDSLKVMLRDLPLDFVQAYRYNDALALLQKNGTWNKHYDAETMAEVKAGEEKKGSKKRAINPSTLFNEGGVFMVIIEQNTETNMKGVDFIQHVVRHFPGLSESDFVLLTHRLETVPQRSYGFPVLEKPLRAAQIRQLVLQKIKQAQTLAEAEERAQEPAPKRESKAAEDKSIAKGIRGLLKKTRASKPETSETAAEESTEAPKSSKKKATVKKATKKAAPKETAKAAAKKAKAK